MGHFVELVLEFLFGLAKDSPDKMPSVNYIDSFVIRHPRKKTLVRILRTPDGNILLDKTGKLSGRGAYICKNPACLKKLRKSRRAEANLGVAIPEEVWDALEAALAEEK